ncbi:MAG: hypothetical protein QW606_05240, partial [Conexivisphaerales archaeon]
EFRSENKIRYRDLREVRIIPLGITWRSYMIDVPDTCASNSHGHLHRINVAIADNISDMGIVVRGGFLKSMNNYFNEENPRLRSISTRQIGHALTKREIKLLHKRNHKNAMHIISRRVVECAKSRGIDTIVIGHNDGWKQSVNMGSKNNQNSVQIPLNTLRQRKMKLLFLSLVNHTQASAPF